MITHNFHVGDIEIMEKAFTQTLICISGLAPIQTYKDTTSKCNVKKLIHRRKYLNVKPHIKGLNSKLNIFENIFDATFLYNVCCKKIYTVY